MIVAYGRPWAVMSGSVSAALRAVSSASSARTSTCSLSSADTPSRRTDACAARPGTVSLNVIAPGVGDDDLEAGRLGDDRHVARRAGADRGEHALAAVLLGRHAGDENLALEPVLEARVADGADRRQDRRDPALHVAGAAAVQPVAVDRRRPRVLRPRREIADRHDVDVPDEHDPPPAGPASRPRTIGSRSRGISSPGQSGSSRTAAGIRLEPLDAAADLGEQRRHAVLDRALVAGDARDPDDVGQRIDRPAGLDRVDGSRLRVAQAHRRSAPGCVTGRGYVAATKPNGARHMRQGERFGGNR